MILKISVTSFNKLFTVYSQSTCISPRCYRPDLFTCVISLKWSQSSLNLNPNLSPCIPLTFSLTGTEGLAFCWPPRRHARVVQRKVLQIRSSLTLDIRSHGEEGESILMIHTLFLTCINCYILLKTFNQRMMFLPAETLKRALCVWSILKLSGLF